MFQQTVDAADEETLSWLAVQYVLGELTPSDSLAFEERLAADPLACAAVAEATRLTWALQSAVSSGVASIAPALVVPLVRSAASPRGSWLALAGAVTAAAGLLAAVSFGPADSRSESLVHSDRSASELISLWRHGTPVGGGFADDSDVEVDESNREVAVPAWLFTAVSLEQSKPAKDASGDWQEN
jgi:anti-sigma factor RsiW